MTTVTRRIAKESDREALINLINSKELGFTVQVLKGLKRSDRQNRLQRQLMNDLAMQGDMSAEEYRAQCKLTIGVPILREESEDFRRQYDNIVKPLTYEKKLSLMMLPIDFPVTRLMTTKQKWLYLNEIYRSYSQKGFVLTDPSRADFENLEASMAGRI